MGSLRRGGVITTTPLPGPSVTFARLSLGVVTGGDGAHTPLPSADPPIWTSGSVAGQGGGGGGTVEGPRAPSGRPHGHGGRKTARPTAARLTGVPRHGTVGEGLAAAGRTAVRPGAQGEGRPEDRVTRDRI